MKRLAFKMYLNEGQKDEYIRRHKAIWPEIKKLLSDAGIREYSVFLDEETNTLFAFQKIEGEVGAQNLGPAEVMQQWWKYMSEIMPTNADYSPVLSELQEVFYLELK